MGDELSTACEVLEAIEEQLTRISELGVLATPVPSATTASNFVASHAGHEGSTTLHVVHSQALRGEGWLRQCIFNSGLGVSGLLEAVHGELTDWQQLPSAVLLQEWRSWDQRYEALVRCSDARQQAALSLAGARELPLMTSYGDHLKGEIHPQRTARHGPLVLEACLASMPSCKLFKFDMVKKMP